MKKHNPSDNSLQYEYKLRQFTELSQKLGHKIFYNFDDRKYVEQLSSNDLNARINQEL